jgi:hypothetical protein
VVQDHPHGTLTLILGVSLGHNRYPSQKRKRHQTRYGSFFSRAISSVLLQLIRTALSVFVVLYGPPDTHPERRECARCADDFQPRDRFLRTEASHDERVVW